MKKIISFFFVGILIFNTANAQIQDFDSRLTKLEKVNCEKEKDAQTLLDKLSFLLKENTRLKKRLSIMEGNSSINSKILKGFTDELLNIKNQIDDASRKYESFDSMAYRLDTSKHTFDSSYSDMTQRIKDITEKINNSVSNSKFNWYMIGIAILFLVIILWCIIHMVQLNKVKALYQPISIPPSHRDDTPPGPGPGQQTVNEDYQRKPDNDRTSALIYTPKE